MMTHAGRVAPNAPPNVAKPTNAGVARRKELCAADPTAGARFDMQTLRRLIRETGGTSNAEYALMMAIVGTAVLMSAIWFGGVLGGSVNEAGTCIETSGSTCDEP